MAVLPGPKRLASLLAILVLVAVTARADTVVLLDGTQHEGEIVSQNKDTLTLRVRWGGIKGTIVIPKADIAALHVKPAGADPVIAEAEALRKEAEAATTDAKKAEAWIRLGDYYQRHPGYSAQAHEAFENALLWDADQPVARARLGYIKTADGWGRPEPKPQVPSLKPDVAALKPQAAAPKPADNIVIGLRRDEMLIAKLLGDQQARKRAEMEAERRQQQQQHPLNSAYYGAGWPSYYNGGLYYSGYGTGGDFVYISPAPAYVYPGFSSYRGRSCSNGWWPSPYFGSGYGGYGMGYSGSYCGGGYGLNIGFRGHWGSTQFSGTYSGGYRNYGSGGRTRF